MPTQLSCTSTRSGQKCITEVPIEEVEQTHPTKTHLYKSVIQS